MSKYIAFDIGNVICKVDFNNFLRCLSKNTNISLDEAYYFLERVQGLHDIGLTHLREEMADHFKIRSPVILDELMNEWNKTIEPDLLVIDFLEHLISVDIKIALLSNIGFEHSLYFKNIIGNKILDNSLLFFSCDVGVRKPSLLYYKTFLDLNPEFKNCIYIDDKKENLSAGQKFGFKTFYLDISKEEVLRNKLETVLTLIYS